MDVAGYIYISGYELVSVGQDGNYRFAFYPASLHAGPGNW
jgi:hypothetical protein